MGRPSHGPYLYLHPRNKMWIIRDGQRTRGTGCYEADRKEAEELLARYSELNPRQPRKLTMRVEHRKERDEAVSFVYVIGSRHYDRPVKIGVSTSPKERILGLQTAHHETLYILAQTPGAPVDEKILHQLFKRDQIKGEWFRRTDEILVFIELIDRRQIPIHLAIKWISDDRKNRGRDRLAIPRFGETQMSENQ